MSLFQKDAKREPRKDRRQEPVYLSPVRRIRQVAVEERVCAVTIDDGPCSLPASPDIFRGKPLTLVLAETLERYGARGTFNVVGDTSGRYVEKPGKLGIKGKKDVSQDRRGGVVNCPQLTKRLLAGGHEISSHGFSHRSFDARSMDFHGKNGLKCLDAVLEDLQTLHRTMSESWGYPIRLARPPYHVDEVRGGFSSFDVYAMMGYQYLDYSFGGAADGSLGSYQAEVEAAWKPMEKLLLEDPDCFRGQIISLRDGQNQAGRTPVAEGLDRQLRLLTDHGYRVVTASELLEKSSFSDVLPDREVSRAARRLMSFGWCPVYRDNMLRPDTVLTRGELAMMAFGWETIARRIQIVRKGRAPFRDMAPRHPYAAAAQQACETGAMTASGGLFRPDEPVSPAELGRLCEARLGGRRPADIGSPITHGDFFLLADRLLQK